jgi:hypothetical protein
MGAVVELHPQDIDLRPMWLESYGRRPRDLGLGAAAHALSPQLTDMPFFGFFDN